MPNIQIMNGRWMIPVALILLTSMLAMVAWAYVDRVGIEKRVATVESENRAVKGELVQVREQLTRIENKLDRLSERR